MGKKLSSVSHPDWLWGMPTQPPIEWVPGFFSPWGKAVGEQGWPLHIVLKLGTKRATCLCQTDRDNFTFLKLQTKYETTEMVKEEQPLMKHNFTQNNSHLFTETVVAMALQFKWNVGSWDRLDATVSGLWAWQAALRDFTLHESIQTSSGSSHVTDHMGNWSVVAKISKMTIKGSLFHPKV